MVPPTIAPIFFFCLPDNGAGVRVGIAVGFGEGDKEFEGVDEGDTMETVVDEPVADESVADEVMEFVYVESSQVVFGEEEA